MGHATLLRRLLPPTSYDPNGARLGVSVDMEGKELDRVLADAPPAVARSGHSHIRSGSKTMSASTACLTLAYSTVPFIRIGSASSRWPCVSAQAFRSAGSSDTLPSPGTTSRSRNFPHLSPVPAPVTR